jgi:hypothetical protein
MVYIVKRVYNMTMCPKIILSIGLLFFCVFSAFAADTYTTNMVLTKPAPSSLNWAAKINGDFDIIDSSVAIKVATQTFTGLNTFTSSVTMPGWYYGAGYMGVGYGANAGTAGTAFGVSANGSNNGIAVGDSANGSAGTALGNYANGFDYGIAVGVNSNGANQGIAVGVSAKGNGKGNVAIGSDADFPAYPASIAAGVTDSIQLGRNMGAADLATNKSLRLWDGFLYVNATSSYTMVTGSVTVAGALAADGVVISTYTHLVFPSQNLSVGATFYAFSPAHDITVKRMSIVLANNGEGAGSTNWTCGNGTLGYTIATDSGSALGTILSSAGSVDFTAGTNVACWLASTTQEVTPDGTMEILYYINP